MDDVHIFFRRGDAALALLLEAVKDEHCFGKFHGVDGAVSASRIIFHHFKYASTAKRFNTLAASCLSPACAKDSAKPKNRRTSIGKAIKSLWLLPTH